MMKFLSLVLLPTVIGTIIGINNVASWTKEQLAILKNSEDDLDVGERLGLLKIVLKDHAKRLAKSRALENALRTQVENGSALPEMNDQVRKVKEANDAYEAAYKKRLAQLIAIEARVQMSLIFGSSGDLLGKKTLETTGVSLQEEIKRLEIDVGTQEIYGELIRYDIAQVDILGTSEK